MFCKQFEKRQPVIFLVLVFWLATMIGPLAATAAEVTNKMDEVVVTASRVEEKVAELTSNITVINQDDIKQSSALNLGDLLSEQGIGHIQKYPGNLTTIGIRGFRTETHGNDLRGHVLILLNGRRSGSGNASKILTQNIERIEIIRGPAAVQYGSAAMGGIINVITRQGSGTPSFFVDGELGSDNYQVGTVGFAGQFKMFDFSGSYTDESMDDYNTADGDRYPNTEYENESLSLNFGVEFLPGHRFGVIYSDYDSKSGNPSYLSQVDLDDTADKSNSSFDIIYDGGTQNQRFSWMARYFNGENDDEWESPSASDPDGFDSFYPYSEQHTDFQGAQAQITAKFAFVTLTTGVDWINYEIDSSWTPEEVEFDNPAVFLLTKATFLDDRLIFTAGARYDDYEVEVKDDNSKENDDNIGFNFGIAYWLNDYWKIRAHYGEAFVMPDADQLAANRPTWGGILLGNPNLDPETSRTYEVGVDYYYQAISSSLTYFYTDFEDKIESVRLSNGIDTWENLGDADISGLEASINVDLGTMFEWPLALEIYANCVYLFEYEDQDGNDLRYTADLNAAYGIRIPDWQGFMAKLNFAYSGGKIVNDWETGWSAPDVKRGGFTVADLSLSKKIVAHKKYGDLTMRAAITNLLDKNYEYAKGYPMPGRGFSLALRYDF